MHKNKSRPVIIYPAQKSDFLRDVSDRDTEAVFLDAFCACTRHKVSRGKRQ